MVSAPIEIVWSLLTDPTRWGDFFDVRITRVEPAGSAVVGQRFYGESGPSFLHIGLKFEYTEGDPHYFPEVFVLHKQLLDYHRRLRVEIPGAQNDLVLEDPTRYEKNIQCYRAKRVVFSFYCTHG